MSTIISHKDRLRHTRSSSTIVASASAWSVWWWWTLAVALGELIGFAIPAGVGGAAYALGLPDAVVTIAVIVAGFGEGAALGVAQWLVLRRYLPGISGWAWVTATALAAGLAWVIGMGTANLGPVLWETNQALFVALAATSGVLFLLSMGGAQWLVLRRHLNHAWWWVVANAVAWPLGVAVPVAGLSLVPDGASATVMIVVGVISGVLMGVVVGAITGVALVQLLNRSSAEGSGTSGGERIGSGLAADGAEGSGLAADGTEGSGTSGEERNKRRVTERTISAERAEIITKSVDDSTGA